ncbi:MAG: T9SS type A sorting domain-containing protein [Flavobacteriales bacterium]|nr:T9SS type A sorting domain-containing protein [Flavobacteriales bacterium]
MRIERATKPARDESSMQQQVTMKEILFTASLAAISAIGFAQDEICPGANIEISTQGMSYSPDAAVVNVGWTVGWVNYGGTHDVNGAISSTTGLSFNNPESFSLGGIEVDSVPVCIGTHTFTIPGVYYYDCSTYGHAQAGMVGSLTVHLPGCMDPLACNYDSTATEDNESCVLIGDACDDGDENTQDDVIQEDCECLGSPVSIVGELEDSSVRIFPNPVASILTITLSSKSKLQVFDAVGKLVEETGEVSSWVLDVSAWGKGLYTVKTQAGETHQFIVE